MWQKSWAEIGKMEMLNSLLESEVFLKVDSVKKIRISLEEEITSKHEESRRLC